MLTRNYQTCEVTAAVVKGRLCTLDDGIVRVYDDIAGHFVRSSDTPSVRSVKAAYTAGRTKIVRG